MDNQTLKVIYDKYTDEDIAVALLDTTHNLFNENNFIYYDYSLRIAYEIGRQVKDNIMTKERADKIHKIIAQKINEMINEIMENRCDKCCGK